MSLEDALRIRKEIDARVFTVEALLEPLKNIVDLKIPAGDRSIPVRVYSPPGVSLFPTLLYIHGAGWVAGSLDTHDNLCRVLANRVACPVISIGYRLAPEYKYPAALEDCYEVLLWAAGNSPDPGSGLARLVVAGDSAGGNLAAALCLLARDRKGPSIDLQLLVNPALDFTRYQKETSEQMCWFREQYLLDEAECSQPYASPLLATDLCGLPRAMIITSELDELCAEGEEYAHRLKDAGVQADIFRLSGRGHLAGQFARAGSQAQEAVDICTAVLKATFGNHTEGRAR